MTLNYKNVTTDINPTMLSTIVYGRAIITILMYERLIKGARDEVKRNKKAAWPFGVAMLGMFVPVLMAIASLSNCSLVIIFISNASLISFI